MIDILVPYEQDGNRAVVRSWLKKVGDTVAENDPLVELETDKVTQEVPAPVAGILAEITLDSEAEVLPGMMLGRIKAAPEAALCVDEEPAAAPDAVLSPAVRQALKQHGIEPSTIPGTGRGGRITRADIDLAVVERSVRQDVRTVPHDRMRRMIARNMLQSVTTAPHVTAVVECDFSAIAAHRRHHREAFGRAGVNLTYTAYLLAASVQAMQATPAINSRWFEDRLEIYDDVSVGVATALGDHGLVVPVLASAQALSFLDIATGLTDLTARARTGRLTPTDMRGGTFTISNYGMSGPLLATPVIIHQPQSAILGVGKLEKRLVVREANGTDTIQIRPMCYVSLTIDHRVVDGHGTSAWLKRFVEIIEGWPAQ